MHHILPFIIAMVIALRRRIVNLQVKYRYRGICAKESLEIKKVTRKLRQLILLHHMDKDLDIGPPFLKNIAL